MSHFATGVLTFFTKGLFHALGPGGESSGLPLGLENVVAPAVPAPELVELPADTLQRYSGRYQVAGEPMAILARDGALYANDWVPQPTSDTTFFSPQDDSEVRVRLVDGVPTALDWGGMECPRVGSVRE